MPNDYVPPENIGTLNYLRPGLNREPAWRLHDHLQAINAPQGIEVPIVQTLRAWLDYATVSRAIATEPASLPPHTRRLWVTWGDVLKELTAFPIGRLDRESVIGIIDVNQMSVQPPV